jgi:tetratricopeptide (TPR) repeat protein
MGGYSFTSHAIMIWQYFVAAAFLIPKLRPIACITGPLFHILVEVIDLKIGWFSYYMIGLYYILLFPDSWFLAAARPAGRVLAPLKPAYEWLIKPRPIDVTTGTMTAAASAAVTFAVIWFGLPMEGAGLLAVVMAGVVGVAVCPRVCKNSDQAYVRAGLQLAGIFALLLSLRGTDALYNYHRYWAGDLKRRGQLVESAQHYEVANSLKLTGPARYFALGEVYERLGKFDDARRAYEAGLKHAPNDRRGKAGLARLKRKSGP